MYLLGENLQRLPDGDLTYPEPFGDLGLVRQLLVGPPPARFDFRLKYCLQLMVQGYRQIFVERAGH